MKKFYLLIMALVCYVTTTMAQPDPDCPLLLHGQWYSINGTPPYCKLFVGNGPIGDPGTTVQMFLIDINGNPILNLNGQGFTFLDGIGSATVEYNCQSIHHIDIDYTLGGVFHKCTFTPAPGGALPIKLSALSGRLNTETEATIAWTSSLEENSFKYEVQRSADGKTFVTVGTVKAAGTSLEAVKYSYNDLLPGTGAYFYRLKMIDIDGSAEMSKVVYVNSKKGNGIVTKIFPNPFTSEVQLIGATSADLNTPGNVKVFSISGQLVNFRIVGANAIAIDDKAPKGLYIVKVKDQTFKLSKL